MKIKYLIIWALCSIAMICSCVHPPVSQESGIDDIAHLLFVSSGNRPSYEVLVTIDGKTTFSANTVKAKESSHKGEQYVVRTGKRELRVVEGEKVLYKKSIFLSTGETKEILLP